MSLSQLITLIICQNTFMPDEPKEGEKRAKPAPSSPLFNNLYLTRQLFQAEYLGIDSLV